MYCDFSDLGGPAPDDSRSSGARTRSATGTSEVGTTNVSGSPGAPCVRPSDCSTTIVATRGAPRLPSSATGSMRMRWGLNEPGTIRSAAGPLTRSLGRSETWPAHASGAAAAWYTLIPAGSASSFGRAASTRSKSRLAAATSRVAAEAPRMMSRREATAAAILPSESALASRRWRSSASTRDNAV